jgi:genome maintenance exonuclease 1
MKDISKSFELELLPNQSLIRVDAKEGRYYTKEGDPLNIKYTSVTTFLKSHYDQTFLEEWRDRVGDEQAEKISTQAKRRGNSMHLLFEKYLLNEDYKKGAMTVNLVQFNKIKSLLDRHVTKIYGIELQLYSPIMKLAGTCDALVLWDNQLTLLDWKTSKYPKKPEYIESYFSQSTLYCLMLKELYDIVVDRFKVIISVDHDRPQIFNEMVEDHKERVLQMVKL